MDMVLVPASITIENGISTQKYRWKSKNKTTIYRRPCKRAFVRITGSNFVRKLKNKQKKDKYVKIKFVEKEGNLILKLTRDKEGATLQTYMGGHPYLQLILNKHLPKKIWEEHKLSKRKTYTRPILVEFNLSEWKDINLESHEFMVDVEKLPKKLLKTSLNYGFKVDLVSKGRAYDLELVGPNGNKFMLAISSHVAKNKSRSKEKRKQKILMDISKMLTVLYNKSLNPVIISEPLEFENSWSFTTDGYLNFYKEKFNFNFLTTDFKKGWDKYICEKLLELDKNVKI